METVQHRTKSHGYKKFCRVHGERTVKHNAEEKRELQQRCEHRETVNIINIIITELPKAWIPESRRTGCLGYSGFLSGVVVRRKEIQCRTDGRGRAGALLSSPGHIHMTEVSRCMQPLGETVKQRTIVTWCVIKLLSHYNTGPMTV